MQFRAEKWPEIALYSALLEGEPTTSALHQTGRVEISRAEADLIIDALEAAAMWHDARSRFIDTAARRSARRYPGRAVDPGSDREADRQKAKDYAALAARLKGMT